MRQSLKHEVRRKPQANPIVLSVLACSFVLVVLPARSVQIGSTTAPIRVSSKEADDNLQVKTLKPEYPPEAKAKGIEGTVRLRVVIDERGNIVGTNVVSGNPLLVPSAIALVKRFPYRPFTRGGKRVSVTTVVDVPFELHPVNTYKDWNAHRDTARQMRKDGRMDAATDEIQKALVDARKLGDIEVADTYGDLADLYYRDGNYADASIALGERLRTLKRSRIQDETEIANTESDLAGALFGQKELDKAEELLERAIPVQERYFRQASFEGTKQAYAERLAVSVEMLGRVYDFKGRTAEAEAQYKRAVSLGENILHPDIEAGFMRNYADMLLRVGRPDEAAKLRENATALQLDLKK
jgi:TonB family protein